LARLRLARGLVPGEEGHVLSPDYEKPEGPEWEISFFGESMEEWLEH
jgi:hypothetical protein